MALALGIIGILGFFPNNKGAIWGLGALLIVLNFIYNITVGPICEWSRPGSQAWRRTQASSVLISAWVQH